MSYLFAVLGGFALGVVATTIYWLRQIKPF